jgi:hypothetical protein
VTIPELTEQRVMAIGEEHLAKLAMAERTPPSQAPVTRVPRLRRVGRWLWLGWIWLIELIARPWSFMWNPRRPLGRWWAHVRLMAPTETFNRWKLLLLVFAVAMGVITYVEGKNFTVWFVRFPFGEAFWTEPFWVDTTKTLFGVATLGLLAALWNDLFRCPWLGHRIRRHIRRDPARVLHDNLGARPISLLPGDEAIKIAPRTEIFDELLPGILARDQKDVQIIVGEPGSGKTTAIVSLSGLLARIGIMPVVVPLRAREKVELVPAAHEQFKKQIDRFVRSEAEAESLWRWLYHRRRVAILTDDIDQIGPDGERGFILRHALEEAATCGLPIIVTARPAGVPAGVAASAIEVGPLDESTAVECVEQGARADPAFRSSYEIPRRPLEDWIREGRLAEIPFYLELLAGLAAVDRCPKFPEMDQQATGPERRGRYRRMPDGQCEWNPLWVRFLLLERFYAEAAAGRVRRWLGIEAGERRSSLRMLEGAALGTLAAAGIRAKAAQRYPADKQRRLNAEPKRERIQNFLDTNDREPTYGERHDDGCPAAGDAHRRARVSAHEATDTGERLRILDRDTEGELQFRHRIMQAYLAGSRLAVILEERLGRDEGPEGAGEYLAGDRPPHQWVEDLLDPHHPEKLTAHMTLVFAALSAAVESEADGDARALHDGQVDQESRRAHEKSERWGRVGKEIVYSLNRSAEESLRVNRDGGAEDDALLIVGEASDAAGRVVSVAIVAEAAEEEHASRAGDPSREIDPMEAPDPEQRTDPDDALMKLTAAAEAAYAIGSRDEILVRILGNVRQARYATRWTKLDAIEAIARLGSTGTEGGPLRDDTDTPRDHSANPAAQMSWQRIWEFARDEDYAVRQTAGDVLCADAYNAYHALRERIDRLLLRAACRSALGLPLLVDDEYPPSDHRGASAEALRRGFNRVDEHGVHQTYTIDDWSNHHFLSLKALGGALPAIVSGLHEDPDMHPLEAWRGRDGGEPDTGERPSRSAGHRHRVTDVDNENYSGFVRGARLALEHLVALSFQGGQHPLEDALARGFKGDAMRHAHARDAAVRSNAVAGPGWVAANRRLVMAVCLHRAESWYARLLLNQALALYTIAGGKRHEALDALARHVHRGREHHPLALRATRLARAAVLRKEYPTACWHSFIWDDEDAVAGRRQVRLNNRTAQLAADVDLLLDLNEGSPGDCQEPFGAMNELPHCLSASRDREEILGKGCPESCGWNFCPYKQPPPDEPSSQRGVSRAFCRQQRQIARHRRPRWQRHIHRHHLRAFWREMERRART